MYRLVYLRAFTDRRAYRPTFLLSYPPMISTPRFLFTRLYLLYDEELKDGRWAYTEIPSVRDGDPGLLEPDVYGKLRAPWNVNDRP